MARPVGRAGVVVLEEVGRLAARRSGRASGAWSARRWRWRRSRAVAGPGGLDRGAGDPPARGCRGRPGPDRRPRRRRSGPGRPTWWWAGRSCRRRIPGRCSAASWWRAGRPVGSSSRPPPMPVALPSKSASLALSKAPRYILVLFCNPVPGEFREGSFERQADLRALQSRQATGCGPHHLQAQPQAQAAAGLIMARIAGVDLPREKRVEIALTYIFGIGRPDQQPDPGRDRREPGHAGARPVGRRSRAAAPVDRAVAARSRARSAPKSP